MNPIRSHRLEIATLFAVLFAAASTTFAASGYFFEDFNTGYSTGVLQPQNGWVSVYDAPPGPNLHGSSVFADAGQVINLGGGNFAVSGGGAINAGNYGSKVIAGGFGLTNIAQDAYYQFDARSLKGGGGNELFTIGPDQDGDGALEDVFGAGGNEGGPQVLLDGSSIYSYSSRRNNETPYSYLPS